MGKHNQDKILDFVRSTISRPLKLKELAESMEISESDYRAFRSDVHDLLEQGKLVNLKRSRIGLPEKMDLLVGLISITRSGAGFLLRDGAEQDIMIPAHRLHTAFDGDKVMVRREGSEGGRPVGAVIKTLERSRRSIVGVFLRGPHFHFVEADDKRIHRSIYIADSGIGVAKIGDKVVVALEDWDDPQRNPEGEIVEVLGRPGERKVELVAIMRNYGLTRDFPQEVIRQADDAAKLLTGDEIARREDLRQERIYTIDPRDAKDHDDAIHVERTTFGFRLGVHIADVSHFVTENTALDTEAYERGNSVYLPGTVIPMLPEALSSDICSLRADVDRLTLSVFIDFDHEGKPLAWRHADTVIRSRAKLAYEDAQAILDGAETSAKVTELKDDVLLAWELSQKLCARRMAEGSLDFDLPESLIEFGEDGEIANLGVRVRLDAHRLIEECMLAANKAVALTIFRTGQMGLYRIHDKPNIDKLTEFATLAEAFGHPFAISDTISPRMVQQFLLSIKDTPEEEYLNELALRSMQKAIYSPENIGHFGLAFKHYVHFTSPIRRFPDLIIHRLLRKLEGGRYPLAYARKLENSLANMGKHCSGTERAAEQAEREAVKMMQALFLSKHVGSEHIGIISGVVGAGFWVKLNNINSEGFVRVSSIDDDYYRFEPARHRMVGARTSQIFRLGDRVTVRIERVDIIRREIDLVWVPEGSAADETLRPRNGKPSRGRPLKRSQSHSSERPNPAPPQRRGGKGRPVGRARKKGRSR